MDDITLTVSQFVAVFNQTLETIYPGVSIIGELANFRVSKNKWVYFDLKDDLSCVKFFGTVYNLPGPIQDGMMLKVRALPRLHNSYGFSLNVVSIEPSGEGSIKKAAELLKNQLAKEGLFDANRKRELPYPPERIGLITSKQSAAYSDFIKILKARWQGLIIEHIDIQVQGENAPGEIVNAIEHINSLKTPPEAVVLIRGGGSSEDLAAFSSEVVTRAVAGSRVPTLVAVGHERDVSLAELAADVRASTPSNAAELLVPDKLVTLKSLQNMRENMKLALLNKLSKAAKQVEEIKALLDGRTASIISMTKHSLELKRTLINAYNPKEILKIGYAIVRDAKGKVIKNVVGLKVGNSLDINLNQGSIEAVIKKLTG